MNQKVVKRVVPEVPMIPVEHLLTVQEASQWQGLRYDAGLPTTSADKAAARAYQNDFIVEAFDRHTPAGPLFHSMYNLDVGNRNTLVEDHVRDLKRTIYSLEAQTDCLVLAYVVSPHAVPAALERINENDPTVVRVKDWSHLTFKYAHIPATHRTTAISAVGGETLQTWRVAHNYLKNFILERFAKPHIELWGRRRKAAGHPGTLTGSLQPFADSLYYDGRGEDGVEEEDEDENEDDDAYEEQDIDGRVYYAREVTAAHMRHGRGPRLPLLIARTAETEHQELILASTLSTADLASALQMMLDDNIDPLNALELLMVRVKDERDGFPIDLLVPKRAHVKRDGTKRRMSKEKKDRYEEFIRNAHRKILELVDEGAKTFNKEPGEVRNRIFTKTRISATGDPLWQAYVHVRAKEINEGE
ncbi:hypothetical protein AURDEDRAFT_128840 [Auricularia subglabra TFB-10046 SS5]|nr:hypothetical protein AURDEDRAFT_128840 [Auricularia subglabra TFB-10046 SS5]